MGLYVVILQFNPNYEIGRRKITVYNQEQVASNCDKARWIGTLYYSFNNGYLSSTKTWQVTGNTEEAKKRMQTNIDRFLMLNPTYTYDRQDIQLFWLPKRFVKENNYPNDWYKLTDPDTIYQPQ
jgi:hypothetical protein